MRRKIQALFSRPEIGALLMLLVMIVIFELVPRVTEGKSWAFVNANNLANMVSVLPELGLMAIGVTLLLIAGEFDLSVGSVSALTPVLVFEMMNEGSHAFNFGLGPLSAIVIALSVAALIGFVNGQVTLRFKIHSFVATLGMLFVARSLAVVVTQGFPPTTPASAPIALAQTYFLGLSVPFWIFVIVAALVAVLLNKTNFGNWIYATGGDENSTHCVGVKTKRVKLICFMISSTLCGLSGILVALRMATATPSSGDGAELEALAATVIGGASLQGGIGTVLGAIVGSTIIRSIDVGLIVTRVDSNWFKFAVGGLLIVAVVFNTQIRQWARKIKIETKSTKEVA
jgi:simple sugar transport system permease protein